MVAGGNFVFSLTAGLFFRYLLIQLRKGPNLRHIATLGLVAEAIDQGSLEQVVKPWNGENISPRPTSQAQSTAHQTFRRLLGRSIARVGVLSCEMNKTNISGLSPIWRS